jgi:hypothetical protein
VNATTTVTVYRGTNTDEYGDEQDNNTVAATGLAASIIEQTRFTQDPSSMTPRVVRYVTGRVYANADVRPGDRIHDERTGDSYILDSVTRSQHGAIQPDLRLELRRVTS